MPPSRGSSRPRDQNCVYCLFCVEKVDSSPLVPPGKHPVFLKKTYLLGVGVGIELSGEVIEQPFKEHNWGFPGGPTGMALCFQCKGCRLDPWLGN